MLAALSDVGRRFARTPRRAWDYRRAGGMNAHFLKDIGLDCPQARWTAGLGRVDRSSRD